MKGLKVYYNTYLLTYSLIQLEPHCHQHVIRMYFGLFPYTLVNCPFCTKIIMVHVVAHRQTISCALFTTVTYVLTKKRVLAIMDSGESRCPGRLATRKLLLTVSNSTKMSPTACIHTASQRLLFSLSCWCHFRLRDHRKACHFHAPAPFPISRLDHPAAKSLQSFSGR